LLKVFQVFPRSCVVNGKIIFASLCARDCLLNTKGKRFALKHRSLSNFVPSL